MATVPQKPQVGSDQRPDEERQNREQFEKDGMTDFVVFLALVVLIGALLWMLSGGSTLPIGE
jgi:hypothetical protein